MFTRDRNSGQRGATSAGETERRRDGRRRSRGYYGSVGPNCYRLDDIRIRIVNTVVKR
jgi:hypothetical protein